MGDMFLNKTPFWDKSCCLVSDILFGFVSFLSGAGLSVGFPITCLGVSLLVEGHVS